MTDFTTLIDSVVEQAASYEQRMKEEAKKIFASVSEAMKEYPNVALKWRQYTPSFNDGEPCTFDVHEIEVYPRDAEGELVGDDSTNVGFIKEVIAYRTTGVAEPSTWAVQYYGEEKAVAGRRAELSIYNDILDDDQLAALVKSVEWAEQLARKLQKLPDDIFLHAFGDGSEVTLTGEGASVEEYYD